jgi:hypothetical protein
MAPSPYSLEGARAILSGPDDTWAQALGTLLGVGVLASGPIGLAAWGWVDQKNELVALLTRLVAGGRERLGGERNRERGAVLAATHTALAYGAFFAALRESAGPVHDRIGLTEADKQRLTDRTAATMAAQQLTRSFGVTSVPLPWAGCGFHANRDTAISEIYRELAGQCVRFLQNFAAWECAGVNGPVLIEDVTRRAVNRYDAEYKLLAADVREFEIWAMLGEHQATRALAGQANESLARLEDLIVSFAGATLDQADRVRQANAGFNRAVLNDPVVNAEVADDLPALTVPTIEQAYLSPYFRWTVMDGAARPADEDWWRHTAREGTDLDAFLAAHFASPQSLDRPLVVLGHPGSGKSMLTKVCAARLSGSDAFAVARIPLRMVPDPDAPIFQQVAEVLGKATQGHIQWDALSEASTDATRVLLIDGLDEYMQASGASESNYLRRVVEFQRIEKMTGHPVAVVVTSRTLVADLARIPEGCPVVKLDDFRPDQVRAWLDIWGRSNPHPAGIPPADAVLSYGDMARQPLLLLLLLLYGAATGLPRMEAGSTPAQIYGSILRRFIQRELGKPTVAATTGGEENRIRAELWRLGIAAFGMFNRGRHYIDEKSLLTDLDALDPPVPGRRQAPRPDTALSAARLMLGRFFFVHAAEADGGANGRSYEFLHATFGEYLIAHFVTVELDELWNARDRPSSQQWDDDRLYALLSHRALNSGASAILQFVEQLHGDPGAAARAGEILRLLLRNAEERWDAGRFAGYDPSAGTYVARYAIYTANLMLLLVHISREPVALTSVVAEPVDEWWRRLVRIWQAYVRYEFTNAIALHDETELVIARRGDRNAHSPVHTEWLLSRSRAMVLNAGYSIAGYNFDNYSPDRYIDVVGTVARAHLDPEAFWRNRERVDSLIRAESTVLSSRYASALLAAHVANNPESYTFEDARSLVDFDGEGFGPFMQWPIALLVAQYPEFASSPHFPARVNGIPLEDPAFAALLAGALVWTKVPALTEVLDRIPFDLFESVRALRPWIDGMAGLVDERRQVLVIAGHLLPVLEQATRSPF